MTETQVRTRYFVKVKPPLTHANLAEWLNHGGDSADTLRATRIIVYGRAVGDVYEISEAQVETLKHSEYRESAYVFIRGVDNRMSVHRNFPAWR